MSYQLLTLSPGRSQAAPLTAWLRVPISWYQSHTQSYYPDETNSTIRRTFTPQHAPHIKRNFCGFCGTHLSYWSEQPVTESEYLHITVGSLDGEDIRALEELDLLPPNIEVSALTQATEATVSDQAPSASNDGPAASSTTGDLSWFEEMLSGSALGRTQMTRRGMGVSSDGTARVEWEFSEYEEGEESESGNGRGKRKIGEVGKGDDTDMEE